MRKIEITIPDGMYRFLYDGRDFLDIYERDALILQPYIYTGEITFDEACEILNTSKELLSNFYKIKNLPIYLDPRDKIYSVTALRYIARDIFEKKEYVEKAYLYGSYAKNTATKNSDINIIVELNKDIGKEILDLSSEFEEATCKDTIIYSSKDLAPEVLEIIKKEFVPLYEKGMVAIIGWM